MAFHNRMLKRFAMAAVLVGGLAVSGSFQEATAQQMIYGPAPGQPLQQPVVQDPQAYAPPQYRNGYAAPRKYKRYANTPSGYYAQGRYYGPRGGYGYGYGCSWW